MMKNMHNHHYSLFPQRGAQLHSTLRNCLSNIDILRAAAWRHARNRVRSSSNETSIPEVDDDDRPSSKTRLHGLHRQVPGKKQFDYCRFLSDSPAEARRITPIFHQKSHRQRAGNRAGSPIPRRRSLQLKNQMLKPPCIGA